MNRADFDHALRQLLRERPEDPAGFRNERCTESPGCLFCTDCHACYRCTYCSACEQCTQCTHCSGCHAVHASSYCRDCTQCTDSQYLVSCTGCVGCTYCYGCVGLKNAEFHILNVAYDRKTYFLLVAALDEAAKR